MPGTTDGWILPDQLPPALPQPIEQWVAAILRDEENPFDIESAVKLRELMEGAYRSHRLGRQITFPLS